MNDVSEYLADIVMEAPHVFSVGDKSYTLYPISLGKLLMIQRQVSEMGIDSDALAQWPVMEIVKVVREHRENCLHVIALATAKNKAECFDVRRIRKAIDYFSNQLSFEDIATLMVCIFTDKTDEVKAQYGIDKEQQAMSAVMKAKSQGGSLPFGGKTILGTLVDQACERYGWTVEYAVWGVSYTTLQMMLCDRVNTVFLTEDERNKVPASILQKDEEVIMGTKENMELIRSMSWK